MATLPTWIVIADARRAFVYSTDMEELLHERDFEPADGAPERFAAQLAAALGKAEDDGALRRLVIAAKEPFLAVLQAAMPPHLRRRIARVMPEDLCAVPEHALLARVHQALDDGAAAA
ncbi:MAG: host attachment protein [Alphaproteobacteria bacterium]|nr:host attachment protein [Alphaproteobacteria bacterium]